MVRQVRNAYVHAYIVFVQHEMLSICTPVHIARTHKSEHARFPIDAHACMHTDD
jgi:hypothetical protein